MSSAALRPLAQSVLFAAAAQVSGPAEIAYLAQVRPMFDVVGLELPVPWPRCRGVLLRSSDRAAAELLGFDDDVLLLHDGL